MANACVSRRLHRSGACDFDDVATETRFCRPRAAPTRPSVAEMKSQPCDWQRPFKVAEASPLPFAFASRRTLRSDWSATGIETEAFSVKPAPLKSSSFPGCPSKAICGALAAVGLCEATGGAPGAKVETQAQSDVFSETQPFVPPSVRARIAKRLFVLEIKPSILCRFRSFRGSFAGSWRSSRLLEADQKQRLLSIEREFRIERTPLHARLVNVHA